MNAIRNTVGNTWRGMIQRRLWPVAALLLAALVAVPLLLQSEPEPVVRDQVAGDSARVGSEPLVAVASAEERDTVRRVLGRRKDPFRATNQPRSKARAEKAAERTDGGGPETARGGSPAGGAPNGAAVIAPANPTVAPKPAGEARPEYPARSLTVRWGTSDDLELTRGNLERLGALPSPDEPVVIYLGLTDRGRTAVFMVDENATPQGDGRCRPDPATCVTLELSRGETAFFDLEGEDGEVIQYQLDLVRIHAGDATASTARKGRATARPARVARRSLRDGSLGFRLDEATGLLESLDDES